MVWIFLDLRLHLAPAPSVLLLSFALVLIVLFPFLGSSGVTWACQMGNRLW